MARRIAGQRILFQQSYVLRCVSHTGLSYILSVGWGIAKCEADSLFAKLFFGQRDLRRRFQEFDKFWVRRNVSKELFPICHKLSITFFRHLFGLQNRDDNR